MLAFMSVWTQLEKKREKNPNQDEMVSNLNQEDQICTSFAMLQCMKRSISLQYLDEP